MNHRAALLRLIFALTLLPTGMLTASGTAIRGALPAPRVPAAKQQDLIPPTLLANDELLTGNPLAPYAEMLRLADAYAASKPMAGFYDEIRLSYEEFLGVPDAGVRAMSEVPTLLRRYASGPEPIPDRFRARDAIAVIAERAKDTQLVIYGEEHHLPQTRSLFEPMLAALWDCGYRYLAAEAFSDSVGAADFAGTTYESGFYTMDPLFANAIYRARQLGYRLVPYDTKERGEPGDDNFRDRTQAENIQARIFADDPDARVLVIAGRSHAAQVAPADGWTPMASVLKKNTGIDPFTIYAPTMGERLAREEEHPMYRYATAAGLVERPVIFAASDTPDTIGTDAFDAYVFWPRVELVQGRPDWLRDVLGRRATTIPEDLLDDGLCLVQAFRDGDPFHFVPIDQVLLRPGSPTPALMLPKGRLRLRTVGPRGMMKGPKEITVE